ncbi:MAG: N-acetyltransferase family protein [Succinivibrio sp.]|nr:N-acetyltransferase family protein [Succinivibrio sp.]
MLIRKTQESDLPAITEIYNAEILNGTATFDCAPKSLDDRLKWLHEHNRGNHPLLTALSDDGSQVLGYASLSPYGTKDAFTSTVELSVYVSPKARRSGTAFELIKALISKVQGDGVTHLIISVITSGNEASVKLHQKLGFAFCGTIPEIARKFGVYLSVDIYVLKINQ